MLRELKNVRQVDGEPRRRWFTDEYFDIIVFYDQDDKPLGFHLCYCKNENERILVWEKNTGYEHGGIDDGETFFGRRKEAPIMVSDGLFEKPTVTECFRAAKSGIDPVVADFIEKRIAEYNFA
jgi:hypothetical protein